MTREEAIELLKDVIGFVEDNQGRDYDTAFRMAIKALQHDVIFEQIKWERDVALQTLEEHGIGLGQKCGTGMEKGDK